MTLDHQIATDAAFLGLTDGRAPGHSTFVVGSHLCRFDHKLYGGTAIAVSLAAIERTTGRNALWATTQFVSTAPYGTEVDVQTDVVAAGRRTSQVRITATLDGEIVFLSLGAAGIDKVGGMAGELERRPAVVAPDDGRPVWPGLSNSDNVGWHQAAELRTAPFLDGAPDLPGRMALWARFARPRPMTPAGLGFLADMVPVAVARGLGITGAGTSIDNTLRVGAMVDTEWVLLDLRPHLASGGYGHGTVLLWAEDGTLLAAGSQTASMLVLEHDPLGR